jgi:hypothetical protein
MKRTSRSNKRAALLCACATFLLTTVADAQQPIWTQYFDHQSQISSSSKTTDNETDTEIADDFDVTGTVDAIRAEGSHLYYFNSPPMNLQSVYVRFYEWQNGTPGALQYEQQIAASAITVSGNNGGFAMGISLPVPFSASGKHFVSVQTVSDLKWSWNTSNSNNLMFSPAQLRNRLAGGSWTTPDNADVAFILYGTLTGAPQLSSISDATLPRSGRLRLFGVNFGSAQGSSEVRIGGVRAIVTHWSNRRIHAYVPEALTPGSHPVEVVTSNGSSAPQQLAVTQRTSPGGQAMWRFQADSALISTPPVVAPDGTIYMMDDNGNLYALTPDGGLLWATKSGFQGSRLARGADGTLYTMADGILRATNPDGTHKWDFPGLNWTISGPNVGPDGNIYGTVQNQNYGFFSVTPEGQLRWANPQISDRRPRGHEIVFSDGQAYINHRISGAAGEWLMAFRMTDGQLRWQREAENEFQPLIGPNGRIYVDRLMGVWFSRVFETNGDLHMSRDGTLGMRGFSPDTSKLYTSVNGITAFDAQTLQALWSADVGIPLIGAPTPDPLDRYLVVRTPNPGSPGNLFILATTGHLEWREDFPAENGGTVIPTGGPVFSPDGNVFYTGTTIATYATQNEYSYLYAFTLPSRTPLTAPVAAGAASRKMHGDTAYDVQLPITGTPGIEPRSGGASGAHQIVVSFATPVTAGGAALASGTGTVSNVAVNGSKVTVNLTGVANAQTLRVRLNNVNDGLRAGDVDVPFSTLVGDVTGNGIVNASDVAATKSAAGQAVTAENFRADVTPNGSVNASDIGLVKSQSGAALPGN